MERYVDAVTGEVLAEKGNLKVKPGTWRIRTGPGTKFETVDYVRCGDLLQSVNTEGWIPVLYKGETRFISKNALEG